MDKTTVSKFEYTIDRINVIYGLILPVGLVTFGAVLIWIFAPSYFQAGSLPVYAAIIGATGLTMIYHLYKVKSLSRINIRILYIFYHIALLMFCIFVAPFLSPFDMLWPILAIGMDLMFGRRWILLTLFIYGMVLINSFIRSGQPPTIETFIVAMTMFFGIFATTMLVSRFRQVSDEERQIIMHTSDEGEFERQRLLSLINNMSEAVVAVDKDDKVLVYNSALLILLDTNVDILNQHISKIFSLNNSEGQKVLFSDLIKNTNHVFSSNEYTHTINQTESMNLFISITPIKLGFKEHAGVGSIIVLRDITKEKSLEEERDEFISVVGHELRTPIAIAEGALGNSIFLSERSGAEPTVVNSLKESHKQILFLASMINDLSTLSRSERDEDKLELSEIQPVEFIQAISKNYRHQAFQKGLKLIVPDASPLPSIYTEELYLHEILQNFITNSLKYTHQGSVTVSVSAGPDDSALFSVSDTGIGLSKSDKDHIFEKFYRSEDFHTRESGGTGLGLYITDKLVRKIKANIKVKSTIGQGSTFTLLVPNLKKKETQE